MSAPTDLPHIQAAAEALLAASPVPGPVIPWLRREHGLDTGEACKAVGIANILRRDRKTRPKPEAAG